MKEKHVRIVLVISLSHISDSKQLLFQLGLMGTCMTREKEDK